MREEAKKAAKASATKKAMKEEWDKQVRQRRQGEPEPEGGVYYPYVVLYISLLFYACLLLFCTHIYLCTHLCYFFVNCLSWLYACS